MKYTNKKSKKAKTKRTSKASDYNIIASLSDDELKVWSDALKVSVGLPIEENN